ncbi:WAT1-related protein At1g43650 isoform X2 [Amborella trichopoda]|uniref:WAT1-related protein At1g43650 isoform X2 n=1 Tax=Amborella trichopoda TaxID=13333 RepID=UPI0009C0EDDF|nr:WAT1-related protein At1g43650 isoform X2 [Amborella trichopoda]|eukprot:XP_020527279.1 WAT1-related protein At1g43650 isoform X2 [Amborella trichopoda]
MNQAIPWFTSMESWKPYLAMVVVQSIYAGMALFSKLAISGGMNHFVFVVYRQALASVVLAPFAYFLERKEAHAMTVTIFCKVFLVASIGISLSMNLYYVAMKYTSATLAATTPNAIPACTFLLTILLRMERLNMRYLHGQAKVAGTVICIGGAIILSSYKGPPLITLNHYHSFHAASLPTTPKKEWAKGVFLMLTSNAGWSLWLVLQVPLIKSYPSKLTLTTLQCFLSALQSAVVAFAVDRRASSWKLNWDLNLISVVYCPGLLFWKWVPREMPLMELASIGMMVYAIWIAFGKGPRRCMSTVRIVWKICLYEIQGVVVTGVTHWLQLWCIEKKGPVFTAMFHPVTLLITAIFSVILWNEWIYLGRGVLRKSERKEAESKKRRHSEVAEQEGKQHR